MYYALAVLRRTKCQRAMIKIQVNHIMWWKVTQRFDVDITWIRRRPNFDEFPRRFHVLLRCNFADRKIHVVSTYFFRRNFDGRKIHVVSTYFFRCNFDGRKIHVVSTYFFRCNFDGRKIHVVSTYFCRCNFDGQKIYLSPTCFFRCNFFHRNTQSFYLLLPT